MKLFLLSIVLTVAPLVLIYTLCMVIAYKTTRNTMKTILKKAAYYPLKFITKVLTYPVAAFLVILGLLSLLRDKVNPKPKPKLVSFPEMKAV